MIVWEETEQPTLTKYLVVIPHTKPDYNFKTSLHIIIFVFKGINHNIYILKSDMNPIMGEIRVCQD
jgi:hypothetical protein